MQPPTDPPAIDYIRAAKDADVELHRLMRHVGRWNNATHILRYSAYAHSVWVGLALFQAQLTSALLNGAVVIMFDGLSHLCAARYRKTSLKLRQKMAEAVHIQSKLYAVAFPGVVEIVTNGVGDNAEPDGK